MSKRRVVEVLMDGLEGVETGAVGDKATRHIVTVGLVWPRPGIAKRIAVKTVELVGGNASPAGMGWTDRILFKETVMGRFGIEVAVSRPVTDEIARKAMGFFGEALAKESASVLGGAAGDVLGGFVSVPLKHLVGAFLDAADKDAGLAAEGKADLNAETPTAGSALKVSLTAPEAIYRGFRQRPPAPVRGEDLAVAAGAANAIAASLLVSEEAG